MKSINTFIWLVLALCMCLVAEPTQAQDFNRTVSFNVSQNGVDLHGTVRIDGRFVFFGGPFFRVEYSELTIEKVNYKGVFYDKNSSLPSGDSKDTIRFPYTFANGSNKIIAMFPIFVAEVASHGNHPCFVNRPTAVRANYTTGVYGISDASEVKELIPHFKQLSSPHKTDAEVWECSEVDTPGIRITELSPSIIFEITNKLNKVIEKQEEEQQAAEGKPVAGDANKNVAQRPYISSTKSSQTVNDATTGVGEVGDTLLQASSPDELKQDTEYPDLAERSVTIGSQIWSMNLNVKHFRNGDLIPHAQTAEEWEKAAENKQPAWSYFDNDPTNSDKHGILYNWFAVEDPRGLAPEGWHIATHKEWEQLANQFPGQDAEQLKTAEGWTRGFHGNNATGFNGYPLGFRGVPKFVQAGLMTIYWTSDEAGPDLAFAATLEYNYRWVVLGDQYKVMGFSVRCVKD